MTKEEIRAGVADILGKNWGDNWEVHNTVAKELLVYLDSQGVVLKVEGELPSGGEAVITLPRAKHISYWRGYDQSHLDMTRAGYTKTGRLI